MLDDKEEVLKLPPPKSKEWDEEAVSVEVDVQDVDAERELPDVLFCSLKQSEERASFRAQVTEQYNSSSSAKLCPQRHDLFEFLTRSRS